MKAKGKAKLQRTKGKGKKEKKVAKLSRKAKLRLEAMGRAPVWAPDDGGIKQSSRGMGREELKEETLEEEEIPLGDRIRLEEEEEQKKVFSEAAPTQRSYPVKRRRRGGGVVEVREGGVTFVVRNEAAERTRPSLSKSFKEAMLARHPRLSVKALRLSEAKLKAKSIRNS